MSTSINRRHIELAHRTNDGVDVYLFWNELHQSRHRRRRGRSEPNTASSWRSTGATRSTPSTIPYAYAALSGTQPAAPLPIAAPPRARAAATRRNNHQPKEEPTMHARIDNPALTVPGALKALQAARQRGQADRHPRDDAVSRRAAREPDQRLRHLRRHPLPRAQACGRTRRAHQRGRSLARCLVLHRGRAVRARADRGRHPSRRPPGPRSGRRVGRRRASLRRGATRRARTRDRHDQRLQPPQRHHPADQRRLGGPVARHEPEGRDAA